MEMDRPLHNYTAGPAAGADDVMDACCYAFLTDDDEDDLRWRGPI